MQIEAAAATGQIVVGSATAAALPRTSLGAVVGPGRLLRGAAPLRGQDEVRFRTVGHDLRPFVPVALRGALSSGVAASEHRRATVAFVQFGGVDALIERSGAARAAVVMDELVRGLQDVVDRYNVCFLNTDIAADGGKVVLTAGVPESDAEDEERALLALRGLLDARTPLPVRVGVNSGHVFAGDIGTTHRRTYTVMGDAVNLAARVMAHAEPGQIVATKAVLGGSRTLFETVELPTFRAKGKRLPVTAVLVGAPRGMRASIAATDTPLIGRDAELAAILDAAGSLRDGSGRVVEIVGEPGSGKTTLLDEVVCRIGPAELHRVQCRQYQSATPHFAVRELLRAVLGLEAVADDEAVAHLAETVQATAPSLLPWLSLIGVPLGLAIQDTPEAELLEEPFRKRQLEEAVVELLGALLTRPTLICVEDAHWLDDASGDLLRAMAIAAPGRPWLICVTTRRTSSGPVFHTGPLVTTVELGHLPPDTTALLLDAATLGEPLPRHVVRALAERSEGNPLFALELLNAVREQGYLEALPRSVEGLIAARIDRLVPEDRALLRHVSVLGAAFSVEHLAALGDGLASRSSLGRLGEFLSIDPTGWVRFRHALVRDVAYAGLPFGTRKHLHGRIAESILASAGTGAPGRAALLSVHFFHAHRYDDAWRFSRQAGDAARSIYANLEAITLYERALLAGRHLPQLTPGDRAAVQEALGDVQDLAGLYEDARSSYRHARRLVPQDRAGLARLALKDAYVVERRGRYVEAVRSIGRGLRLLEGADGHDDPTTAQLRAQLTVWYAAVRANQGNAREAVRWAGAGIELAEAAGDDRALARAYLIVDYAESVLGARNDAKHTVRALDIYSALGDLGGQATASNNLGFYAYFDGRWSEALELYERSRAARLKAGDPTNAAMADANIAEILANQGHLAEAEELLGDASSVLSAAGDVWALAFATEMLGLVAARAGRTARADELLAEARGAFARMGALGDVGRTDVHVAENLVLSQRPEAALSLLAAVLDEGAIPDHLPPTVQLLRGIALSQAGHGAAGRDELLRAVSAARERGAAHQLAVALDVLANCEPGRADARAEADEIFARLGVVMRPVWPTDAVISGSGSLDRPRSERSTWSGRPRSV